MHLPFLLVLPCLSPLLKVPLQPREMNPWPGSPACHLLPALGRGEHGGLSKPVITGGPMPALALGPRLCLILWKTLPEPA